MNRLYRIDEGIIKYMTTQPKIQLLFIRPIFHCSSKSLVSYNNTCE
jgi:hypothetical protein